MRVSQGHGAGYVVVEKPRFHGNIAGYVGSLIGSGHGVVDRRWILCQRFSNRVLVVARPIDRPFTNTNKHSLPHGCLLEIRDNGREREGGREGGACFSLETSSWSRFVTSRRFPVEYLNRYTDRRIFLISLGNFMKFRYCDY